MTDFVPDNSVRADDSIRVFYANVDLTDPKIHGAITKMVEHRKGDRL